MKSSIARAGALVLMGLFVVTAGRAQDQSNNNKKNQKGNGSLDQQKPGDAPASGPAVTKDELNAYKALYAARAGDPNKITDLGEAFVAKFPDSVYAGAVYSEMTSAYLQTNQTDKMMVTGTKALEKNPDNVDVLPIMAWAIPRKASSATADGADQIKKAQAWAHHGIDLITSMPKPAEMDDAAFSKAKNDKLALCHDGLGVSAVKAGKFDEAIPELTQSIQLSSTPDPVDYYLLGVADENGSHFTDAIAAFTKCSADGPMQAQCKGLLDETKKKSANSLEAPK
jgi:tetratricopeptide (TPR) repeat protein